MSNRTAVALVCALAPAVARAQVPLGLDFQVNVHTIDHQWTPAVAASESGGFVVAWESFGQDGDRHGIFARRYDASGAALGSDFQVNTYITSDQLDSAAAADAAGNFVVVWHSYGQDGQGWGVFARRFAANGTALGADFRVNSYTSGDQRYPAVAAARDGRFVVVWSGRGAGDGAGVFGRRFDATGAPSAGEFRVNSSTPNDQAYPAVAALTDGIVVVWNSVQAVAGRDVLGQRYDELGFPQGTEFRVNTVTTGNQSYPVVAADPAGNFVVAWIANDGHGSGVFAQVFQGSGVAAGTEFRVNTYITENQSGPSVAGDGRGGFLLVWHSFQQDGYSNGVVGRRVTAGGIPRGDEFLVNAYTAASENNPAVAVEATGTFVVAWDTGDHRDGDYYGVFARRFAPDDIFADGFE
jgi:hypothetical protein